MAKKSTNPVLDIFSVFNEAKGRQEIKMTYAVAGKTKTTTLLKSFTSKVDGAKHVLRDSDFLDQKRVEAHARALAESYIFMAENAEKWTDEQKAEASANAKAAYNALSEDEKARRKELAKANANRQFGIADVPAWMTTK